MEREPQVGDKMCLKDLAEIKSNLKRDGLSALSDYVYMKFDGELIVERVSRARYGFDVHVEYKNYRETFMFPQEIDFVEGLEVELI